MIGGLIQINALADLIAADGVLPIDCRFDLARPEAGKAAFDAGHIPGAAYFDLDKDLSDPPGRETGRHPLPDRDLFAARLRATGARRGLPIVCYDDAGGAYAARAWWLLRWLGHEAAAVLDGGFPAWVAAGQPLEAGDARARPAGDIVPLAPRAGFVDTAAVVAALGTPRLHVIDARTPARFAGEPHPLDSVAGHIPGAHNRFYGDNLDGAGRFKPVERLRREWEDLLAGVPPEQVVLHCGSGVTACHDLLAMHLAGLEGARLYPGSWSAWTSDPARPVARGDA